MKISDTGYALLVFLVGAHVVALILAGVNLDVAQRSDIAQWGRVAPGVLVAQFILIVATALVAVWVREEWPKGEA